MGTVGRRALKLAFARRLAFVWPAGAAQAFTSRVTQRGVVSWMCDMSVDSFDVCLELAQVVVGCVGLDVLWAGWCGV